MESEAISWMRTASASVAATQALVTKPPESLGVIGTGNSAYNHIRALTKMYKFKEIKTWSRNPENVENLCSKFKDLNVKPSQSAEEAVRDADIVAVCVSSSEPVLMGRWLKPGCHVNAIGALKPTWRELDDELMNNAVIYVDSIESALTESGDIIQTKAEIYAEIGDIFLKRKVPKYGQYTLFKSSGLAIEDAYAAKLVWDGIMTSENK